jgi:hypothetical protein
LVDADTGLPYLQGADGRRFYFMDVHDHVYVCTLWETVVGDLLRLGYRPVCGLKEGVPFYGIYDYALDGSATFRDATDAEIEEAYQCSATEHEIVAYVKGPHGAVVALSGVGDLDHLFDLDPPGMPSLEELPKLQAYLDYEGVVDAMWEQDEDDDRYLLWTDDQGWSPVDLSESEMLSIAAPLTSVLSVPTVLAPTSV